MYIRVHTHTHINTRTYSNTHTRIHIMHTCIQFFLACFDFWIYKPYSVQTFNSSHNHSSTHRHTHTPTLKHIMHTCVQCFLACFVFGINSVQHKYSIPPIIILLHTCGSGYCEYIIYI